VTSPPYHGVKRYGSDDSEIGTESLWPEYISNLTAVFREVKRTLRDDGVLWLNIADSYFNYRTGHAGGMPAQTIHHGLVHSRPTKQQGCARRAVRQPGLREKSLMGIPWRLAFSLMDDGWVLRSDCLWVKGNPTPEKVKDRPTKCHEYVFLFAKNSNYWFDHVPLQEKAVDGSVRNGRTAWHLPAGRVKGHNAVFPLALAERCVRSGCPAGGTVLDPFCGSGTSGIAARNAGCHFVGIDLYVKNIELAKKRLGMMV
jgi:DNA modification methylase